MRCPQCGHEPVRSRLLDKYHYRESGLENVWLYGGGVTEFVCERCGYRGVAIQKEAQLLQVIALSLLMRPGLLRGTELRYLRREFDLTQKDLAAKVHVRRGAIVGWESGQIENADVHAQVYLRMVLLREFQRTLSEGNFLSERDKKRLEEFEHGFLAEVERLSRRPRLVSITLEKRNDWEPRPKAA